MENSKEHPSLFDRLGNSDGLQVAVIGCGAWGKNLVRCFAELNCLGAVADHHSATVAEILALHGGQALTFEQILVEPSIQAVAIATQPSRHFDLAKRALLSGKHVFVEKPLALEFRQAKELAALARRSGLRLMIGHILRFHPAFARLQTLIASGGIGRLLRLEANRKNLGAIRSEEDVLWCLGPHDVSIILALVGSQPTELHVVGGYHLRQGRADTVTLHLAFPAGERAQVNLSWLHPVKEHRLTVIGSEAMVVFDDGAQWDRKLLLYPHIVKVAENATATIRAEPVPLTIEQHEPLKLECQHFINCIVQGSEPITNGEEGLRVTQVLAEASAMMKRGHGLRTTPGRVNARHHHLDV